MSFASYFTSAFKSPVQPDSHPSSKKRKRNRSNSDEASTESEVDPHSNSRKPGSSVSGSDISTFPAPAVPATLRRELAVQYLSAGQPFDADLPDLKFPHASLLHMTRGSLSAETKVVVKDELTTLKPPLNRSRLPGKVAGNVSLRQRHLDNITAVLHRCVLEGDFLRAGRAWGMLLRAEKNGHGTDIRQYDRWGLGAEILLRRDSCAAKGCCGEQQISGFAGNLADNQAVENFGQCFSRKGFENAKDYYERLILQYPYRKAFPIATSALDFYPAMFGLWLYVVQDQHKIAFKSVEKAARESVDHRTESSFRESASLSPLSETPKHRQIAEICHITLERGDAIASRIDELLVSPPYSDDSRLWCLRGMVALWIADLWNFSSLQQANAVLTNEEDISTPDPKASEVRRTHQQVRPESEECLANQHVALSKAKQAFSNATLKGGNGGHTVQYFNFLQSPKVG